MIQLHRGEEAEALLQSARFRRQWAELYSACPYGTCFQDQPFAITWYRSYTQRFEPLIVTGENAGALSGLLLLAVSRGSGEIVHVGGGQAEYHTWLASDPAPSQFIEPALARLAEAFPRRQLKFLFLPGNAPFDWSPRWTSRCVWRSLDRPLLSCAPGNGIAEALRKKRKKMRLNQLERLGELKFERIEDPEAFESALDEIIPLYDFRQAAMYGSAPFASDDLKRPFYTAMMRQPGLLHVTTLRLNGQLISAHIGPINKSQIVLGAIAQSPLLSRHSLGRIHILLLGLEGEKDGLLDIDLTPGAGYKEELSSHHDEVRSLTVYFSPLTARRRRFERAVINASKRLISPAAVKRLDERFRPALDIAARSPVTALRSLSAAAWSMHEIRIYSLRLENSAPSATPTAVMKRDVLQDLLRYVEEGSTPLEGNAAFLRKALERLEAERHVYTLLEKGKLVFCGWLAVKIESISFGGGQSHPCAPHSAALLDFYVRSGSISPGFLQSALRQMVADAASYSGTQSIYLCTQGDNALLQQAALAEGFQLEAAYSEARRLGTQTLRRTR